MKELASKRMEELLVLAEHDPEAQFQLGLNYANGSGVKQDWDKCVERTRRAAEQGYEPARNKLRAFSPLALLLLDEREQSVDALLEAMEKMQKDGGQAPRG